MASSAEGGQVINCRTVVEFDKHFQEGIEQNKLVVVDFTAAWCPPCRFIAPFFAELAKAYPNVIFVKVDVDELKAVAHRWDVTAMPTFIFFKGGERVHEIVGADKTELSKKVMELNAPSASNSAA